MHKTMRLLGISFKTITMLALSVLAWIIFGVAPVHAGPTFENFDLVGNNLASNRVTALAVDGDNQVWIGLANQGGLYNGSAFQRFGFNVISIMPNAMAVEPGGGKPRVWMGSAGRGLVLHNAGSWETFDTSMNSNNVVGAVALQNGDVWAGARFIPPNETGGAALFDGAQNWDIHGNEGFREVTSIAIDSKGRVWLASFAGLFLYDGNLWQRADLLNDSTIDVVAIDKNDHVWLGLRSEGVWTFDGQLSNARNATPYFGSGGTNGLPSDTVQAITFDRENNVWIGTSRGLVKFDRAQFSTYTTREGLPSDNITSLAFDNNGELWIGTDKGLSVMRQERFGQNTCREMRIDNLSPSSGSANALIDIIGCGFENGGFSTRLGVVSAASKVLFDGEAVNRTFIDTTRLRFRPPSGVTCGSHTVQVMTPSLLPGHLGQPAERSNIKTYNVTADCQEDSNAVDEPATHISGSCRAFFETDIIFRLNEGYTASAISSRQRLNTIERIQVNGNDYPYTGGGFLAATFFQPVQGPATIRVTVGCGRNTSVGNTLNIRTNEGNVPVSVPIPQSPQPLSVERVSVQRDGFELKFSVLGQGIAEARFQIFDTAGRLVHESDASHPAQLRWNLLNQSGRRVSNGVYFYHLSFTGRNGETITKIGKFAVLN